MPMPGLLAVTAQNANVRSMIVRTKETAPHPVTQEPIVTKPTVFLHVPGSRSVFFGEREVKMYGFATVKDFFLWLRARGEVAAGEVVYSFCIGKPKDPVGTMTKDEVEAEIRARLHLGEEEELGMKAPEAAAALKELRRIAGEWVDEPRAAAEPAAVAAEPAPDETIPTDRILRKHTRR